VEVNAQDVPPTAGCQARCSFLAWVNSVIGCQSRLQQHEIVYNLLVRAKHSGETAYNDGKPLKLELLLPPRKRMRTPRVTTSGIVITFKMYNGQSAGKTPKSAMQGYGAPSTTTGLLVLGN
jgi:hypothetical protein